MRLGEWLASREYITNKACVLTVGSDGLKPSQNNLMSIGLHTGKEHSITYITGADPSAVVQYTGVSPSSYTERAVGADRAKELILPILYSMDFYVVFNKAFVEGWLDDFDPKMFEDKEVLDLSSFFKLKDMGEDIPPDVENLTDLNERISACLVGTKYRKGYKLEDLQARYLGDMEDYLPALEMKPLKLYKLYETALML